MSKNLNKLLVFTKAPLLGEVKTRLQPDYSPEQSLKLHQKLVLNTLETTAKLNSFEVELCCAPDRHHMFFMQCENQFPISLNDQQGDDLGERMAFALSTTLQTYEKAVIIGTDCPELDEQYINQAFKALDDVDAVIGPAVDGGYVLLGLRRFSPDLFADFSWGTNSVLEQTREVLNTLGWIWHELETKQDLDRPDDLLKFNDIMNEIN